MTAGSTRSRRLPRAIGRAIPYRAEGYDGAAEFLPADGRARARPRHAATAISIASVRELRPRRVGVAADFSAEMLGRARARFADDATRRRSSSTTSTCRSRDVGPVRRVVSQLRDPPRVRRPQAGALRRDLRSAPARRRVPQPGARRVADPGAARRRSSPRSASTPADDDPSNQLAPVGDQLGWLRDDRLRAGRLPLEVARAGAARRRSARVSVRITLRAIADVGRPGSSARRALKVAVSPTDTRGVIRHLGRQPMEYPRVPDLPLRPRPDPRARRRAGRGNRRGAGAHPPRGSRRLSRRCPGTVASDRIRA